MVNIIFLNIEALGNEQREGQTDGSDKKFVHMDILPNISDLPMVKPNVYCKVVEGKGKSQKNLRSGTIVF